MKTDESWVAEQARLIDLEEGFGPEYAPRSKEPAPEADPELAA
ncbi:MAG TPA: hypothetical protein VGS01_09885 [Candidatus Limnocylindria bacterium]|jgi:hypothetical protein|nr:hypothetical protein [Candidatus Limnocylindria bacterium]